MGLHALMNETELAEIIHRGAAIEHAAAIRVVAAIKAAVTAELAAHRFVSIRYFGTFKLIRNTRASYYNPRDGGQAPNRYTWRPKLETTQQNRDYLI